ncbi:hypothetical protein HN873_052770 [Arachis hypogaea]
MHGAVVPRHDLQPREPSCTVLWCSTRSCTERWFPSMIFNRESLLARCCGVAPVHARHGGAAGRALLARCYGAAPVHVRRGGATARSSTERAILARCCGAAPVHARRGARSSTGALFMHGTVVQQHDLQPRHPSFYMGQNELLRYNLVYSAAEMVNRLVSEVVPHIQSSEPISPTHSSHRPTLNHHRTLNSHQSSGEQDSNHHSESQNLNPDEQNHFYSVDEFEVRIMEPDKSGGPWQTKATIPMQTSENACENGYTAGFRGVHKGMKRSYICLGLSSGPSVDSIWSKNYFVQKLFCTSGLALS